MELEIIRLENQLMEANCFIVVDKLSKSCIIIDPASEKAEREVTFIKDNHLQLDYILITHTHADHCWGVNILKEKFPQMKLLYHEDKYMNREIMLFFRMWHEDVNYIYDLAPADILVHDGDILSWHGHVIKFILTPGHSMGSICIDLDGILFTGDTIMPYPPYFNGRGSDKNEWVASVKKIEKIYNPETMIYPGHGEVVSLGEWRANEEWIKTKITNV